MIVVVLLLPVVLGGYEPEVVVPGPVKSTSRTCPEGHPWIMGQCYCYDSNPNCKELIEKYTCEPWTHERYLRESLPANVRQVCGYSCGLCDARKTATDSAPSPSPAPVGTTNGGAGPSTPSGSDNGSAEVNVGIGSGTPKNDCRDLAPAWACNGLKKVYA